MPCGVAGDVLRFEELPARCGRRLELWTIRVAATLEAAPGKALLKMEYLALDAANIPLEYKVAHYRSDRYSFSLVRKNMA